LKIILEHQNNYVKHFN